ncbi:transportin [Blastocystis sp. subtype 4]|uniref:transportin n=1 Tax=Blastocystis sp. subtype 4 TaxID=944170 RepID=UPI0007112EB6|nr:transportin [Blastocystis sp. subtype 4]KNB41741.1 transportin [Blastocystis sp. subtype 4]|eukprot:XP_014525184.1 transportin [Blastocystis sp. subtype 4]
MYAIGRQLEEAKKNPEFLKYIVFIFAFGDKMSLPSNVRIIAGYTLKSCLKLLFDHDSNDSKAYIRSCVLNTLIDPNNQIRNAAGVLITQLVTISGLESWPDLLPALLQLLKSDNQDYIITSLSCLSKLMEDNIYELDSAKVNHPLNELIPLFLSFFQCPNEEIIYHSVNCMRFSIDAMPNALLVNMDNYIHGLAWLMNRANPETLAIICNSLVSLMGVRVDALINYMNDLFGVMLQLSQHQNSFVATQATGNDSLFFSLTEFWSVFATLDVEESILNLIIPVLPQLIPTLIHSMRYSDEELARMNVDNAVVDSNGVRPFIYHESKTDKNDKTDDEDMEGEWTLRKASAWALDCLANPFAADVMEIMTPIITVLVLCSVDL